MSDYGASSYKSPCHWVRCSGKHIPHNAVAGGEEKDGKFKLFVARAVHKGDVLPGKVVPSLGTCYVSYGGVEIKYTDYQALVSDSDNLTWLPGSGGGVPTGAIQGGTTSKGEPLYIGRVHLKDGVVIGKVHPSNQCMYIPYYEKEYKYTDYEVLVCKTVNF
ncbi:natterin-3-like [Dermacentor albipictus]|uniref:natterin-3-like n=1 Tax=Dermacentor albipictus TaxID=60249 RepID=UPI0031FCF963